MKQRKLYAALIMMAGAASVMVPVQSQAAVGYDMRERVIELSGITDSYSTGASVTRGGFAKMLVRASDYRSIVSSESSVSVFSDVPKDSEYASYIRIAAKEGWMSGYLGGQFKPDEYITMQDAERAVLAVLGYTNEDFTGDQVHARSAKFQFLELGEGIDRESGEVLNKKDCINLFYNLYTNEDFTGDQVHARSAKFQFLELGEGIDRESGEVLNKKDCINLFYNLLRTKPKDSNTIYGSILGCELTEDGEINPLNMVDNSLKGPKLVRRSQKLSSVIPFDTSEASWFLNGESAYEETVKSALANDGYGVIYWNSDTKTVWYYSADSDDEDTGRVVVRGEVTHIYYNSSDVMIPSAVLLDNDDEEDPQAEYTLTSSELQYAFSMYGTVKVGDDVVLICEKTTNADGEPTYRVVDFLEL